MFSVTSVRVPPHDHRTASCFEREKSSLTFVLFLLPRATRSSLQPASPHDTHAVAAAAKNIFKTATTTRSSVRRKEQGGRGLSTDSARTIYNTSPRPGTPNSSARRCLRRRRHRTHRSDEHYRHGWRTLFLSVGTEIAVGDNIRRLSPTCLSHFLFFFLFSSSIVKRARDSHKHGQRRREGYV